MDCLVYCNVVEVEVEMRSTVDVVRLGHPKTTTHPYVHGGIVLHQPGARKGGTTGTNDSYIVLRSNK